ncbi:SMI1/KNR4 family protein [Nonomuraea sp. ZG12]|uniref:SMI1/KNR4 family protein n=1 Tax=Nonomuraea sp. ZG12 TaxID=3452207 RepID=UPI003F899A3E
MWNAALVHRRLAEIERQDPEHRRFGASRHHYRLGRKLSERKVAKLEKQIGIQLPDTFRVFLTEVGNGGAGPSYGMYTIEEALRLDAKEHVYPDFYTAPFPHTEDWTPPLEEQPEDYEESRWITGSLVLAEFGCGAFHRLVVNGPVAGEVWFDDQGSDGGVVRERNFYEWYMAWLDKPDKGFFPSQASGGGAPAPG